MVKRIKTFVNRLQEFSVPLIIGVIAALVVANLFPDLYHDIVHHEIFHHQHWSSMHFLVNDIFMVFFFGIAAKEIVESFLDGGALNPVNKAVNPLLGTIGGVLGPVLLFFALTNYLDVTHLNNGWGIPTATDIALAWLAAKLIFGATHPAINFLLLLAIVDDAIGLGIIAIFYGDPDHPVNPMMLILVGLAMISALILRKKNVRTWPLYIFGPGILSWLGLFNAHLHPALALVFIVPFLPASHEDPGLFIEEDDETYEREKQKNPHNHHSPLDNFEHFFKGIVDFGLFFFAFANAGVAFSSVGTITWIIFAALIVGKLIGITLLSYIGIKAGFPLPEGMSVRHLIVVSIIAGIGLTVALFVAGAAYTGAQIAIQGPAKMGALFSGFGFLIAFIIAKLLKIKRT
ncbi:sodium:proton antiporter [Candidatus Marinamargulisbacteria bacterium SCGC AG-343-D04]|nr:sodium:proton antiporter [Candidatus Marinamargulisbacteria bacterium SCGC AG-343-D04]